MCLCIQTSKPRNYVSQCLLHCWKWGVPYTLWVTPHSQLLKNVFDLFNNSTVIVELPRGVVEHFIFFYSVHVTKESCVKKVLATLWSGIHNKHFSKQWTENGCYRSGSKRNQEFNRWLKNVIFNNREDHTGCISSLYIVSGTKCGSLSELHDIISIWVYVYEAVKQSEGQLNNLY